MATFRAGRQPDQDRSSVPISGKTYFLGIGINAYQHWPRLYNAVRDVEAITSLLTADFGLLAEHTHLLLDEQATEEQIIHQLEALADTVQPTDSLLIYYAGHGYLHRSRRGFWVPADAPRKKIPRLIRNSTIRDYIGDIPSLHTLLISDSCFSGSLFVRGQRRDELEIDELASLPSRWAITSGRLDETVADGPRDGHSPFAQSILDVLRMPNRDRITANFLYEQVREQTVANGYQMPDGGPLMDSGHQRGQYVFRRVRPATPLPAGLELNQQSEKINAGPDMVFVPGGTFKMGDVMDDNQNASEKPVHRVMLRDFYLGRYPVTFDEYDVYCEATGQRKPSDSGWGRGRRPVINVSWFDAVSYCNWLSEQEGFGPVYTIKDEDVNANWGADGYRLPTEAEWEYAARQGGENVRFGNGKNFADPAEINFYSFERHKESYSKVGAWLGKTIPVGSLESPNRLGLHDMSGNVSEWCWDWWGAYNGYMQNNPKGPEDDKYRINRGGSFRKSPRVCRSSSRGNNVPKMRGDTYGFRVSRTSF